MSHGVLLGLALLLLAPTAMAEDCPATLDFSLRPLAGKATQSLCEQYAGKVLLVVNTASECGFTPQYAGLDALYARYREQGFAVLGFPSNDFAQEPGEEAEIQSFCRLNYGVRFPMFEKLQVQGEQAHPFFKGLAAAGGGYPRWNFHKYLLDRQGKVVASFPSRTGPDDPQVVSAIEKLL